MRYTMPPPTPPRLNPAKPLQVSSSTNYVPAKPTKKETAAAPVNAPTPQKEAPMKTTENVIKQLELALASEMQAIAQYRQDAAVLDNLGLPALAKYANDFASQEEEHRRELFERVTFLEGAPSIQAPSTEWRGDVEAILRGNLKLEMKARDDYQKSVEIASADHDEGSRALFSDTEMDEEKHINFWEGEIYLLTKMGEAAYLTAWKARA